MRIAKRAACTAFALGFCASSAHATDIPPLLKSGTFPMWASMGIGPSLKAKEPATTQFKMMPTFGYHFRGGAAGPAVAADLHFGFGDGTSFGILPRFVWDIQVIRDLGLYISPSGGLGFTTFSPNCQSGECGSESGVVFNFSVEAKLILANRGLVYLRPFGLDIQSLRFPDPIGWETGVHYEMLFGGGAIF